MFKRVIIVLLVLAVGAGAFAYHTYLQWQEALTPVAASPSEGTLLNIPSGSSTAQVAALLEDEGLIHNATAFILLTRLREEDGRIQAGWYQLSPDMGSEEILEVLSRGDTVSRQFTVPEGLTALMTAELLAERGMGDASEFFDALDDASLVDGWLPDDYAALEACANFGLPQSALEGYLFPETYRISYDHDERDIIELMISRFRSFWTEERLAQAEALGLNIHEVVTLASIVEREARVAEERGKIAAVFLNRLERGMLLGACSTVLYVQGRRGGAVLESDLDVESPYNTYRHPGLPPGPIANPGPASIEAVLDPADIDYLYFVARGDGTHAFSHTYSEHLQNMRKYGH